MHIECVDNNPDDPIYLLLPDPNEGPSILAEAEKALWGSGVVRRIATAEVEEVKVLRFHLDKTPNLKEKVRLFTTALEKHGIEVNS